MQHYENIARILEENGGYISASCCRDSGCPTVYLNRMVKACEIEPVARGLYKRPDASWDEFFICQYMCPRAVFSYETALALHGETDKMVSVMDVTVPRHCKVNKESNVIAHYEKDECYNLGVTTVLSPCGNLVKVYNLEKTLCDFVKHKSFMDPEVYVDFLKRYAKSPVKDLNLLGSYAKVMNISKKVRDALEVLL